jgi:hypothetical protein
VEPFVVIDEQDAGHGIQGSLDSALGAVGSDVVAFATSALGMVVYDAATFGLMNRVFADAGEVLFPGFALVVTMVHGVEGETVPKNDADRQKGDG